MLTKEETKKLATKAFNEIIKSIKEQKKDIKAFNEKYPNNTFGYTPSVDLSITMKHGWEGAKDEKYRLTIFPFNQNGKQLHIIETDNKTDLNDVIREVFTLLNQQDKVKGWSTLKVVREKARFGHFEYGYEIEYPSMVTLCNAPCKEYTALQKYINKYGKKNYWGSTYGAVNLGNYELYYCRMGGKRGELYGEEGERRYLDNRPKYCETFLNQLKANRGAKDIMLCTWGNEDYIDPIDRQYSQMHEIECDGERRHYLNIVIKTPMGKVKYNQKIY